MILELHLIQNFAPSNLNRSDTGSPKDCTFGGVRRARISSQCFKRAMRTYFRDKFEKPGNLAERSTRLIENIAQRLVAKGRDAEPSRKVALEALTSVGLKASRKDASKTEYLLFMGRDELDRIAATCEEHFDELASDKPSDDTKKAVKKALMDLMNEGKAADLGLFGRMLADLPERNRDAASQVAHAISTHKVGLEFDFFTAVDDLRPEDTAGSDHLGTIEFNSACFYRYANVNIDKLRENLQKDEELTKATIDAYIRAAVEALPTGKQTTFATHEKPSLVYAVVRDTGMMSLANAFEKPVYSPNGGLVDESIKALAEHYGKITGVYGDNAKSRVFITTGDADTAAALGDNAGTFDALLDQTISAIFNGKEA
ncbi:type I-E CRISPR-associated protein Cas7/Cse4/CasC [Leptolyngbya sp. 7M]|uniref:type I-E CRISPR-associated protein Cas7/Cse4/CasC n=1 Tax=Leptolyngbya sp. 7M TaxID=2812896 RepID=UPI001B8BA3F8|nr:type I-E CRISPR-associated protein Cas7/Cse4/CasC [Leptolyngbya sp. 7M]QYO66149.1 type I-E CRISPR-associated protein Cas7/Cse4/CasC [Leptolyngbya sp. 7M]